MNFLANPIILLSLVYIFYLIAPVIIDAHIFPFSTYQKKKGGGGRGKNPGWRGSVDSALTCGPEGYRCGPGQHTGQSPVGGLWKATDHVYLTHHCFFSLFSVFPPLSLTTKTFFKKENETECGLEKLKLHCERNI